MFGCIKTMGALIKHPFQVSMETVYFFADNNRDIYFICERCRDLVKCYDFRDPAQWPATMMDVAENCMGAHYDRHWRRNMQKKKEKKAREHRLLFAK